MIHVFFAAYILAGFVVALLSAHRVIRIGKSKWKTNADKKVALYTIAACSCVIVFVWPLFILWHSIKLAVLLIARFSGVRITKSK